MLDVVRGHELVGAVQVAAIDHVVEEPAGHSLVVRCVHGILPSFLWHWLAEKSLTTRGTDLSWPRGLLRVCE
jgi:hypothetical protein